MRLPRSLATRVTLVAVAAVGLALLAGGIAVVVAAERSDRDALDRDLEGLAQARRGPALRVLRPFVPDRELPGERRGPPAQVPGPDRPPGTPPPLEPGSDRFVRVVFPTGRVTSAGAPVPGGFPVVPPGPPRTVTVQGEEWRTVARPLEMGGSLQVAARLAPVRARADRLRRIVVVVAVLALLGTALVAGWLVRVALAPLRRLRGAADRVAKTADLSVRVPARDGPVEVRELAEDLNAMLERLGASAAEREAALTAARRFAADAGHELRTPLTSLQANLSAIRGEAAGAHPDAALAASHADAQRLGALVEQLQALARGEAGAPAAPEDFDAAEVVDSALAALRSAHPDMTATLEASEPGPALHGDAAGLRMLVDNLLGNAARHGRPNGTIAATVATLDGAGVQVTVDDDGPGIPASERERVLERFARGTGARGLGTGLGLSIAAAQAQRHGGTLTLESSPLGGVRAIARLPGVPRSSAPSPSPPGRPG
jgi:signal transduction histidine kinase